jgi:aspartate/methionine/tyrosine aminotransferase
MMDSLKTQSADKTLFAPAARLEGIGEYYFSQKLREIDQMNQAGKKVINLGIGSPDLPPHPDVISVLQEESAKAGTHGYQNYKGIPSFREAIASWYDKWYGVQLDPATEILPLIGSKEGIMHLCMTYLDASDIALVPDPGYPTYQSAVKLAGGEPVTYKLTREANWFPDFVELKKLVKEYKTAGRQIKMMWVNYPHMPTGQLPTKELFEKLVAFGKQNHILICHDNPYSFILNPTPMSILCVEGAKETAVELNSLSKAQNMAGWRVGMLVGSNKRIEEVLRFKSNMDSGMFMPLQLAAIKALSLGKEWYDQLNATYALRRESVLSLLKMLDARPLNDQAGLFVWAAVPDRYTSGFEMSDAILKGANVFITPGGIFGQQGEGYIRVSLCSSTEKLKEAIGRISVSFNNRALI